MSLRPPRAPEAEILSRASGVEAEILHEKAHTLSRLAERLTAALRELSAFDAAQPDPATAGAVRERLLARAGEALWHYVVQREVCGLRDTESVMRDWEVPREVQLRMGTR